MKFLKIKNLICVLFVLSTFSSVSMAATETETDSQITLLENLLNTCEQNEGNNSVNGYSCMEIRIILTRIRTGGDNNF